jgi:hypothetical protein
MTTLLRKNSLIACLLLTVTVSLGGCATKAPIATGEIFVDSMTVPIDFEAAWLLTRDVLLDQDVEIYTRDKRGMFEVYTEMHRRNLIVPWRTKLTITLESETRETTKIAIETVKQKYSVGLLTYPGWLDQDYSEEESHGVAILESIKSRIATD